MKVEIMKRFDGQRCTIDNIIRFVDSLSGNDSLKTVIWNVNDLVKQSKAIHIGREFRSSS